MRASNNTVLITGGTSGIGYALARKFLDEGNEVIITGRSAERLQSIRTSLPRVQTVVADMTDSDAITALVAAIPAVNILVNNAALQLNYELTDSLIDATQINVELQTNLVGPLTLTKLLLPQLLTQPSAAVVNITSGLGYAPKQSAAVYCASKAGLHMFTKVLRWQLETTAVKVFEVIPPLVDTPMTAGRGRAKISPEALALAFWHAFTRDQVAIPIGGARLLLALQRVLPAVAERQLRHGV